LALERVRNHPRTVASNTKFADQVSRTGVTYSAAF
jgi:hypothetical protein